MSGQLKLLNFIIANEEYLLPIGIITEILRYQPVTSVPTMPDVIHGVLNLRGTYVPVIDLAKRLIISDQLTITQKSCIVITRCKDEEQEVIVGLLIDEVNDFIDVDSEQIAEPPRFGHAINADLIQGLIQLNRKDYLVLNVEKLLDLQALLSLLENMDESDMTPVVIEEQSH